VLFGQSPSPRCPTIPTIMTDHELAIWALVVAAISVRRDNQDEGVASIRMRMPPGS
jgi:hypothetical protein